MNRLFAIFVAAFAALCSSSSLAEERPDKPNVILLLTDDLGWQGTTHYVWNLVDENHFLVSYPKMRTETESKENYSTRAIKVGHSLSQ